MCGFLVKCIRFFLFVFFVHGIFCQLLTSCLLSCWQLLKYSLALFVLNLSDYGPRAIPRSFLYRVPHIITLLCESICNSNFFFFTPISTFCLRKQFVSQMISTLNHSAVKQNLNITLPLFVGSITLCTFMMYGNAVFSRHRHCLSSTSHRNSKTQSIAGKLKFHVGRQYCTSIIMNNSVINISFYTYN